MICSSPVAAVEDFPCGLSSPAGEIGMVERSTGEAGLASPLEGISEADDMGTGKRSETVAFFKAGLVG